MLIIYVFQKTMLSIPGSCWSQSVAFPSFPPLCTYCSLFLPWPLRFRELFVLGSPPLWVLLHPHSVFFKLLSNFTDRVSVTLCCALRVAYYARITHCFSLQTMFKECFTNFPCYVSATSSVSLFPCVQSQCSIAKFDIVSYVCPQLRKRLGCPSRVLYPLDMDGKW